MNEIDQAITQALQLSATVMAQATEICYGAGTLETAYPFVVFFKQPRADADRYSFSARVARLQRYVVKAVDIGMSKQRAQEIADVIDAVLTDSTLTLSGWHWQHCHRTGDVEYQETLPDGQVAWHVGGVYEITVGKA